MRTARSLGLGVVLGLTSIIDVAHAQEPESAGFEERYQTGLDHFGAGSFEDCAHVLIELYNEFEDHDRADEVLFNAAECSTRAGMVGQAVQLRTELLDRHPKSDLAASTLLILADSYTAIAEYADAADLYEKYVAKYPEDKASPGALQNAYLFRVGLGQTDAAMRNLDEYERIYEDADHDRAATVFWSRHDQLESSAKKRKHALEFLELYGHTQRDRAIVAEAVIAQIDWRRSCPEPLLYDSCISIERERPARHVPGISAADLAKVARVRAEQAGKSLEPPKRCGGPGLATITVHPRKAKLAADAQARFKQIFKRVRTHGYQIVDDIPEDDVARIHGFRDAWGMTITYQADVLYEEFLRLRPPDNLEFIVDRELRDSGDPTRERLYKTQIQRYDDSQRRLAIFVEQKRDLAADMMKFAAEVKSAWSPHWLLVSAARSGMMLESAADQLEGVKIPRGHSSAREIEEHCQQLTKYSTDIREQAIQAWQYCVERSTEMQFFNEASRLCEARLAALEPLEHPLTHELFGESVYAPTRMRTVGVLPESGVPKDP